MRYSYKLFSFYDIKFSIHLTYILLIILAPLFFYLIFNLLTALAILQLLVLLTSSVLLHELGHAYIARKYRVYLKEIILLPLGGISIRKALPKNTFDELRIALWDIGVYCAIVLVILPFVFYLYGFENILNTRIYDFSPLVKFFQINIALLVFNIIPLYPLDGGRILRSYLTYRYNYQLATKIVTYITYIFGIIIIIFGLIFDAIILILALFLYAGAQGKGKFDKTLKTLSLDELESGQFELEREKYHDKQRLLLKRTKEIQLRAETVLEKSRIGILPKFWLKFRDTFELKITKGRLNQIRDRLISLLPLIYHIIGIVNLWLRTKPFRKSIFFLLLGSIFLSIVWLVPPLYMIILGFGFIICFGFGALVIYFNTPSKKLVYLTILGTIAWVLYIILDLFEPLLSLDYWGYLYYEAVRGCLVPVTGIMYFAAIINSNNFFKAARTSMPLPALIIASALFIIGTVVLFYEIHLLSAFETDLDTIRFTLRYDISYLIWFLASAVIFSSLIYLIYIGSISQYGRITTQKATVATVVILFLISFFTRDFVIIMLGRFSVEPAELDLRVGLHGSNITALEGSEFDRLFHLELTWNSIYRNGPGSPDWRDKDWQMDYAEDNNIDIYLLINPQIPRWFVDLHPDSVMRDQWNNTFFWIDEDPQKSSANRVWDLSFNDPDVINAKINFTLEALQRYHNLSVIKYISIQNEPTYPVDFNHVRMASYDPVTIDAFQTWVEDYYFNNLLLLKNETGLDLISWSELTAPRSSTEPLWELWLEFRELTLIDFVNTMTHSVQEQTTKPVTVKILGHYLARYSTIQTGLSDRVLTAFFEVSDIISLDLYPLTTADLINSLEFYKKLASGKPIIVSEFNLALGTNLPGSGSMFYYNLIQLNNYAEAVIIYTADDHYIYGINLYEHTPVHLGLKLYKLHRADEDVFSIYSELLWENLLSIPNYYGIYLFGCAVWNLPVIPWPILFLIMLPVPIANEKSRRWVNRIIYALIILLLVSFFIWSNLF
jgi:Zn-dependent protease